MSEETSVETPCYLPRTLINHWLKFPEQDPIWSEWLTGSLMHCDVTGFTTMNEKLSKLGNEGGEIMAEIINRFFDRMLSIADQWNGIHMKYGGDAMLLLFSGSQHAERACITGLEMQQAMAEFSELNVLDQVFQLRMRIGIHSGRFLSASIGNPKGLLHYMLLGQDVNRCAQVEPMAEPGQVVVSDATVEQSGDSCEYEKTGHEGIYRVNRVEKSAVHAEVELLDRSHLPTELLCRYLMPPIAQGKVTSKDRDHRRVSIVFISVRGLTEILASEGDGETVQQASDYVRLLLQCAEKYGGYFSQSDVSEKGSTLVVLFGAPISHGNHEENACRFAYELNEELKQSDLRLKHQIGINTGYVFAGETGSRQRRDYTTTGDNMNLAARLMGVSGIGNILISATTAEKLDESFQLTQLDPIKVKGKDKQVNTFRLERIRQEAAVEEDEERIPFIGRKKELGLLLDLAGVILRERSGWSLICGEPGIGKTRLGTELLNRLLRRDWKAVKGICQFYDMNNAFSAWKYPMRSIFEISSADDTASAEGKVVQLFQEISPEMIDFSPLLSGILSVPLAGNPVVESLDNKTRREKLFETVKSLLVGYSHEQPFMVMLDNVQWMDSSSAELIAQLVQIEQAPIYFNLISQPETSPESQLGSKPDVEVCLLEMPEEECREFISYYPHVIDELVDQLVVRAKGNPLFLRELVSNISTTGEMKLPDSIYDVIMTSFDKLTNDDKTLVRKASVIGQAFDVQALTVLDSDERQALNG